MLTFIPLTKQALAVIGASRSKGYADISRGLLPRPIKTGRRAAALLAHEVQTVIAARAAGLPDEAMRKVVSDLESLRGTLAGLSEAELRDTTAAIVSRHARGHKA